MAQKAGGLFQGDALSTSGSAPPAFDINTPLFIDLRCGDRYVGFFRCEGYGDRLEAKGVIAIELECVSNGPYIKNPTADEMTALNTIAAFKFGLPANYFGVS